MADVERATRFLDFLVAYNHDLRTPLNSIIGFSRVILKGIDGPINDVQAEDLTSVHDGGQQLLAMLNEVIDMAKLETGRVELSPRRLENLGEILADTANRVRPMVEDKQVQLNVSLPEDLPPPWGDDTRTRQVLLNLASFCARNTDAGSVAMRAAVVDGAMSITVADTSRGWPPEEMAVLFEPYRPPNEAQHIGGAGLSLAIARELAALQGGALTAESQEGRGTTFTFTLPLAPPKPAGG